jgi:alkanesulfonate monooxygenase SsuD/methylene tetrahydromethanopterin reductase-like flavin-dependent oxidoreductase (luciferase family)
MVVEIGVMLPVSTPDPRRPVLGDVRASARFAEEAGLGSVWSTDHLIASAPILESTAVLATAAAVTERVAVGYGVMLLALRPVAWAAKQVTTLQYLSGDRIVLGVGTGNPAHGDAGWRAAEQPFADRGARTDAALDVLPALIRGEPAPVADGLEAAIAPGSTVPPILVAGEGARARRRAARYGDGWLSIGLTPDQVRAGMAEVTALAEEYGRPVPRPSVVGPVLADDPGRAAADLEAYARAGVERVILGPTSPDWQRDYDRIARIAAAQRG